VEVSVLHLTLHPQLAPQPSFLFDNVLNVLTEFSTANLVISQNQEPDRQCAQTVSLDTNLGVIHLVYRTSVLAKIQIMASVFLAPQNSM